MIIAGGYGVWLKLDLVWKTDFLTSHGETRVGSNPTLLNYFWLSSCQFPPSSAAYMSGVLDKPCRYYIFWSRHFCLVLIVHRPQKLSAVLSSKNGEA